MFEGVFESIEKAFFGHNGRIGLRGGSTRRSGAIPVVHGSAVQQVSIRTKPKDYSYPEEHGIKETKAEHSIGGIYTKERTKLHNKIVNNFIKEAGTSEAKPIAILTGGGTASGKSTMLRAIMPAMESGGKKFAKIDSDKIKEAMPDYHTAKKANPRTAATTVHEESSDIANKLFDKAVNGKHNLVYDGTMSNPKKYLKMIDHLKANGYEVHAAVADVSIPEARRRSANRAREEGRTVPDEILVGTHAGVPHTVKAIKDKVDRYDVYDTTNSARRIASSDGVVDRERYAKFNRKGGILSF